MWSFIAICWKLQTGMRRQVKVYKGTDGRKDGRTDRHDNVNILDRWSETERNQKFLIIIELWPNFESLFLLQICMLLALIHTWHTLWLSPGKFFSSIFSMIQNCNDYGCSHIVSVTPSSCRYCFSDVMHTNYIETFMRNTTSIAYTQFRELSYNPSETGF